MKKTLISIMLMCAMGMNAKVKLLPIFSNDMVLQQQTQAPLWGEATPGKTVSIITSWDGKTYTTKAAANGCSVWQHQRLADLTASPSATAKPCALTV